MHMRTICPFSGFLSLYSLALITKDVSSVTKISTGAPLPRRGEPVLP
jgi:hypothetical protein